MIGIDARDSSPAPEKDPSSTVELVGFKPSLRTEGAGSPSVADAAALASRRRKKRLLIGGSVLLLLLLCVLGPASYHAAKTARAASLARSAENAVQRNQVDEAIATVRSAYMMAPNEPEVLRAMAKILTALNAPSAMNYWNWVLASRSSTTQDRREAAECALRLGLYNQAGSIIKDLLKANSASAPDLLLAARYYSLGGAGTDAIAYATRATQADPTYIPAAIFLAVQQLASPDLRQAGIDTLLKIAHGEDPFAFLAIERLAQDPNLTSSNNQELLSLVQSHPRTTEGQKIVELVLQLKLNPAQHDTLLKTAVAQQSNASVDDMIEFGTWLNSAGESKWVFDLVPKQKIFGNKGLFLIYLDALGAEKRWDEMSALLEQPQVPLESAYIELYLFRCAREMGKTEAADLHWRSAQVAASHNARQSLYLASYAEKLGDADRAESIYRLLTQDMMVGRPAYLGLLRIYRTKDTVAIRDLLDQMASRWPQDEAIANDDIYYNLLLNAHVSDMCRRAVTLAKADVHSAPHLTDVALAYLRMHDPKHALEVLQYGRIQWQTASPETLVVYAATLEANGQNGEAEQALSSVNRATLRPEEQALIQNIH